MPTSKILNLWINKVYIIVVSIEMGLIELSCDARNLIKNLFVLLLEIKLGLMLVQISFQIDYTYLYFLEQVRIKYNASWMR